MNNSITVQATFAGTNMSMDYETGKQYTLNLVKFADGALMAYPQSHPEGSYRPQPTPYSSFITFLQNWTDVKTVKS